MFKKGGFLALFIGIFAFSMVFAGPTFAAGTISGTVTNASTGAAIPSFYVSVVNTTTEQNYWDETIADGTYTTGLIPSGTYSIYPNVYYYYSLSDPHTFYISKTATATVTDDAVSTADLALTPRGRFVGKVYASNGTTPIENALVSVTNTNGYTYGTGSDNSQTDGSYYATPSPTDKATSAIGTYSMVVLKTGYFSQQISNLSLATDAADVTHNVNLTAASTVKGKITDASGVGIPTATIYALKSTGYSYFGTTDANGDYTLSIYDAAYYNSSAVGSYTLYVTKTGYLTQSKLFSLTADETNLTDYNFTLTLGGIMNGHVYASDGATPVSSAAISANDGYGNTYSTTSNSDGSYSLTGLRSSDNYTITVSKTNYVAQKLYNYSATVGETINDQNFNLAAALTFSGIVTDKDGNIVEGAIITFYNRSKLRSAYPEYSGTSISDGTFSLTNVVPNNYRVVISKSGYVTKIVEKLSLDSSISDKTYALTAAAMIYGQVTNKGEAVKGAAVYAYAKDKDDDYGYNFTTTDNDGYYSMSGLQKGTYQIKVVTTAFAEKIITKKLKAGHEKTINIKLTKGGSFSGYVWDSETNLPLSGFYVRIKGLSNYAITDNNGFYYFDGVAKGKYKPYIISAVYETNNHSQIKVKANKVTEGVNFTLVSK